MKKREVITIGVAVLVVGLLFVVLKLSGNNSTPPVTEEPVTEEPVTEEPEREASGTRNTKELKRGLFDPPRHSGDSNKPKSLSDADVERLLKEAVDMESLEERDGLYYQPNESEPHSGWTKTMSDSEYGKGLTQFKDGKIHGLHTVWHENGQKLVEGTYKSGEAAYSQMDGLFPRINLFAFAVPVFRGNQFSVFPGYFAFLLPVFVPRRPETILFPVGKSWPAFCFIRLRRNDTHLFEGHAD